GRVFPIPARGYNRVILAYEELLPFADGKQLYRFALPDTKLGEVQFTLTANAVECKGAAFKPDAKREEGGSRAGYRKTWKGGGPGGAVRISFPPPAPRLQPVSGRRGESGPLYVYARARPELKVKEAAPFAEHAVFLLDASLSEHPARFDVSMKLMKKILEADEG